MLWEFGRTIYCREGMSWFEWCGRVGVRMRISHSVSRIELLA